MRRLDRGLVIVTAGLLVSAVVASLLTNYLLYVLTLAAVMAILAVSLDVLIGFTGYLSLAQGTMFGVGAYTCALLTTRLSWSFWPALVAAALIAGLVGAAVGFVSFRTRGLYFAVLTLGIGLIGFDLLLFLSPLTGGIGGFVGIPSPDPLPVLGMRFAKPSAMFQLALVLLWVTYATAVAFVKSPLGAACLAVREDETLARSLGIRIAVARLAAFVFAAFFAGAAGAYFAAMSNFIGPDSFTVLGTGFQVVVMIVVGGSGTVWGPMLGAVLLTALPESLRATSTYSLLAYGLLLLLAVLFAPRGIAGLLASGIRRLRSFDRRRESAPEAGHA